MMINAKRSLIAVAALSVMILAFGGMAAWAETAPAPGSLVIVQQTPASGSGPSIWQYQVVTPTPGTGSYVIVQQLPAAQSGPSMPQYQLVIPGPNPAQNTAVGLGQQLSTTRGNPVTVYAVPTL